MSGIPTETELQAQWRNAIDILESMRAHIDDTHAGSTNMWDDLTQSLEGEYTPTGLANALSRFRSGCSSLISSATAIDFLTPIIFEYATVIRSQSGDGSGVRDLGGLMEQVYRWFIDNNLYVDSRSITFDTTSTAGGSNVGNGDAFRVTVDENNEPLEACYVERKTLRCVQDQNNGAREHAEIFEMFGTQASQDAVSAGSMGSGDSSRVRIVSGHAGQGAGGSVLKNSSFSTYNASATQKFNGWTEMDGGDQLSQDTTNFYRSAPGASTDASLQMGSAGGDVQIGQTLADMNVNFIDRNTPYFYRVMWNREVGSASGGSLTIRLGNQQTSVALAAQTGWQELVFPAGQSLWPGTFATDGFDVEIEWASPSSGSLLIDDVIFAPMQQIDGTWWFIRGNNATHQPWDVDDTLTFTDSGGNPGTGKINFWLWRAGLGYLPTSGTTTFADPT